ncbi:MAG: 30S ribosomal protein S15 [Deltaproteobacteria bacterium]|nr:30S ribosomal protein S15 [Deltaproteobacteria bacterium]
MSVAGNAETSTTAKADIIKKFRLKDTDTGSPEVQIALLTQRIQTLATHFESHAKDRHSNRGMLALVSKRKRLLQYLKTENAERYKAVINSLGLRK